MLRCVTDERRCPGAKPTNGRRERHPDRCSSTWQLVSIDFWRWVQMHWRPTALPELPPPTDQQRVPSGLCIQRNPQHSTRDGKRPRSGQLDDRTVPPGSHFLVVGLGCDLGVGLHEVGLVGAAGCHEVHETDRA